MGLCRRICVIEYQIQILDDGIAESLNGENVGTGVDHAENGSAPLQSPSRKLARTPNPMVRPIFPDLEGKKYVKAPNHSFDLRALRCLVRYADCIG